jgi:peptidoglycan/LPS O-acetylase OafA/YrhL
MTYRADIDALRALAVVLVVLFHAQLPVCAGGFVGVDVFFVISGYLITGIITGQIERGTFSLLGFYESRLRRIVPALAVMVGVVFLVCYGLGLYVDDFQSLRRSVRASLLFYSNVYFRHATGYFDVPAHSQVFLHTWTLGVEAQFYLLHPLLVAFVYRRWPARLTAVLAVVAVASFAVCVWTVRRSPEAAFYLLPSRAWELLVGGLLATTRWTPATQAGKRRLVIGGLAAIITAAMTLDHLVHLPFPGFAALVPVLGAAACIAGGDGLVEKGRLLRWVQQPAVVFVGLMSYSLYLWHWPVFVIARRISVDQTFTAVMLVGLFAVMGLLAVISWRFVETPLRRGLAMIGRGWQVALLTTGVTVAGLPSALLHTQCFITSRQAAFAAGARDRADRPRISALGVADGTPRFLLLGDSHALAVSECFARVAEQTDTTGRLFVGGVLVNAYRARARDRREVQEAELRELIERERYETAYIVKRWSLDVEGYLPSESPTPGLDEIGIIYDDGARRATGAAALDAALHDTVALLQDHGVRRVYLLLPIPECSRSIPQAASFLSLFHDDAAIDASLGVTRDEYRARNAASIAVLERLAAAFEDVELLDPWPLLGREGGRSRVLGDHRCLYYDDDHLSITGAARLKPLLLGTDAFRLTAARAKGGRGLWYRRPVRRPAAWQGGRPPRWMRGGRLTPRPRGPGSMVGS